MAVGNYGDPVSPRWMAEIRKTGGRTSADARNQDQKVIEDDPHRRRMFNKGSRDSKAVALACYECPGGGVGVLQVLSTHWTPNQGIHPSHLDDAAENARKHVITSTRYKGCTYFGKKRTRTRICFFFCSHCAAMLSFAHAQTIRFPLRWGHRDGTDWVSRASRSLMLLACYGAASGAPICGRISGRMAGGDVSCGPLEGARNRGFCLAGTSSSACL